MKLGNCDCGRVHLTALKRPWWARLLFPKRKRYYCTRCGTDQLQTRF